MYISGPINANPGMRNAHWPGLSPMAKNGASLTLTENWERLLPLERARAGCCTKETPCAWLAARSAHLRRQSSFCADGIYPSATSLRWTWCPMEATHQWVAWLSYSNNGSSPLLWYSLCARHMILLICSSHLHMELFMSLSIFYR